MRGLNLIDRVVGCSVEYTRDISQLGRHETECDLTKDRTVWMIVQEELPAGKVAGINKHTGEALLVDVDRIHTIMPLASDNDEEDNYVSVGDIVVIDDETDCIVPAGVYRVSQVNANGSFHVGGNTAIWPRRILEHYEFFATGSN